MSWSDFLEQEQEELKKIDEFLAVIVWWRTTQRCAAAPQMPSCNEVCVTWAGAHYGYVTGTRVWSILLSGLGGFHMSHRTASRT